MGFIALNKEAMLRHPVFCLFGFRYKGDRREREVFKWLAIDP